MGFDRWFLIPLPAERPPQRRVAGLALGALLLTGSAALRADGDTAALQALAGRPLVVVEAESALGSARLELGATDFVIDGDRLSWASAEPIALLDARSGREVARLESIAVTFVADPVIQLGFIASSGGAPTNFTLTSGGLSFVPIPNALGLATTGFNATDVGGDGVSLVGNNPDGQIYQAFYNDVGGVPASGSTFATLGNGVASAAPYTSRSTAQPFPAGGGFSTTAESGAALGTVSSMSVRMEFQVGALDGAGGSTVFAIGPIAPAEVIGVVAEGEGTRAAVELPLSRAGGRDGALGWSSAEPTILRDELTGEEVGRIETESAVRIADHFVSLHLSVSSAASPVVFTITSASISFPAVPAAFARASAGYSLTDFGGEGAGLTGNNGAGRAYEAFYNDVGGVPATGSSFATLVGSLATATPFASAAGLDEFAGGGLFSATAQGGATLGSVSSMSVRWTFSAQAHDAVSGTSVFALHPGGTVGGRVYQDTDGDGAQGAGEPGLAGVDVVITDSQSGSSTVTTDANGDYGRAVPAGSTTLDVDETTLPAGGVQTQGTDPTVVVVPEGGSASDVDGYQFIGSLTALVFEDSDGSGAQDAGEPGLPGIDVAITDSLAQTQTLTTDATGHVYATLPAGSTTVDVDDATLPQHLVLTAGTDPAVVVVAGGAETEVLFGYRFLPIQAIPTLDRLGLALLALLLGLGGVALARRRRGGGATG